MTAPCQRSQKGRTLAATVRVHDELRAAISDRRNRRVARGPARLCRRRCMEKGDEVVNPFLVFKLPRRSPSASQEEGRDESSPQNPEETTCCADGLARRFGARYRGMRLSRSSERGKTVGFALGSLASGTLSLAATKRFQKSSPVRFPPLSVSLPTLDSLNDGNKMSRNQRLTRSCWTMRYLAARVEGEQLILFEAQHVSLTRRDGRSDVAASSKGQRLVGIGLVVVVPRWALGPRRRPQRDRLGSTRPDPGSRFASALAATGLGWPCSSVCGLFASCCQSGDPDAQKPREIGQAFCGGTGGEDGNLGPGCHCCPSDAGRVCLGGHQVRWPARKHAGVQGGRWMDIFCEREGGWSQEGERHRESGN